mmetsp:Transcript_17307/g.55490  ORF Transcript_17307/g.55490 Transcript_17307/m.55490 type:complete len:181 (+) Transcript_17307:290-832(+)
MLFTAQSSFGDLEDRLVLDLGCGAGMLGIGAALLGAQVVGVDVDLDALEVAQDNMEQFEDFNSITFLRCNVESLPAGLMVDTVITNPPFGTRKKGADMAFLQQAFRVAATAVYSLHKSSTRAHIAKVAPKMGAATADVIAELRYNLPASYKWHKEKDKDIEVDLWRFAMPQKEAGRGVGE